MAAISSESTSTTDASHKRGVRWYFRPYLLLVISIIFSAAAQVFLKLGIDAPGSSAFFNIPGVSSGFTWLGILSMISSLIFWLGTLREVPLIVAFNLSAATHVLVPLASWFFLGEQVSPIRWVGILIVVLGVLIVARPLSNVEERL